MLTIIFLHHVLYSVGFRTFRTSKCERNVCPLRYYVFVHLSRVWPLDFVYHRHYQALMQGKYSILSVASVPLYFYRTCGSVLTSLSVFEPRAVLYSYFRWRPEAPDLPRQSALKWLQGMGRLADRCPCVQLILLWIQREQGGGGQEQKRETDERER